MSSNNGFHCTFAEEERRQPSKISSKAEKLAISSTLKYPLKHTPRNFWRYSAVFATNVK